MVEEDVGRCGNVRVEGWGDGDSGEEGAVLDVGEVDRIEEIVGGERKGVSGGEVKW